MLKADVELIPPGVSGIERRIYASACIVSHYTEYSVDYIVLRDPFIGLLGMRDECECLGCSPVMKIHAILHDAYGKLDQSTEQDFDNVTPCPHARDSVLSIVISF